jgi:uncharacterized membrane protein YdjX (TVP38/TMEM64 family)
MPDALDISVVIPVFNEEDNLETLANELEPVLKKLGRSYEVIFVNDCSTDSSPQILEAMSKARPGFRYISHRINCGESAAQASGFSVAKGEIIITMDADGQNDPADIPNLLAQLTDEMDCVCGVRRKRIDSWLKRVSSRTANRWRAGILGDSISDAGCTYRVIRRRAVREVLVFNGMHRFLPTMLRMQGFKVTELLINHRARMAGVSKYGLNNRLWRGIRDIFAMRWYAKRVLPGRRLVGEGPSVPPPPKQEKQQPLVSAKLIALFAIIVTAMLVAHFTPLREHLGSVEQWRTRVQEGGVMPAVAFIAASALLVAIGVPRLALCVLAGAIFKLGPAIIYSQVGPLIGAYAMFLATRWGGRQTAESLAERYPHVRRFLQSPPSIWSVFVLRQVPMPGLATNVILGVSPVTHLTFLIGSLVGFLPEGIVATLASSGLVEQTTVRWVSMLLIAVALAAALYWLIRRLSAASRNNIVPVL